MAKPVKPGYKKVTRSWNRSTSARRKPPTWRIDATGRCVSNVAATEMILPLISQAGEYPSQFNMIFAVNEALGTVTVDVAKENEEGAVAATLSSDRRQITAHLGGVFADAPALAPTSTRHCPFRKDEDGSLVINLAAGVVHQAKPRKKKADGEAASGKDKE